MAFWCKKTQIRPKWTFMVYDLDGSIAQSFYSTIIPMINKPKT